MHICVILFEFVTDDIDEFSLVEVEDGVDVSILERYDFGHISCELGIEDNGLLFCELLELEIDISKFGSSFKIFLLAG
jgi:hypothetical protein